MRSKFIFVICWQNEIKAKVERKIKVKLTIGVQFTNISKAAFSNKSVFA